MLNLKYTNSPKVETPNTNKSDLVFNKILPLVIRLGFVVVGLLFAMEYGAFQ